MKALALLCSVALAPSDCNQANAVRWWLGDPCGMPSACLTLAEERASKTGVGLRPGEYWVFTSSREVWPKDERAQELDDGN